MNSKSNAAQQDVRHTPGPSIDALATWLVRQRPDWEPLRHDDLDPLGLNRKARQQIVEAQGLARQMLAAPSLLAAAEAIVAGYTYDPGSSDLDNEQPIVVRMTLGDYRKATLARWQAKGAKE